MGKLFSGLKFDGVKKRYREMQDARQTINKHTEVLKKGIIDANPGSGLRVTCGFTDWIGFETEPWFNVQKIVETDKSGELTAVSRNTEEVTAKSIESVAAMRGAFDDFLTGNCSWEDVGRAGKCPVKYGGPLP